LGVGARIATAAHSNGAGQTADQPGDLFEPTVGRPAGVFVLARVRLYREALVRLLAAEPLIRVLGGGDDAGEGIGSLAQLEPDVVLLDASTVNDRLAISAILEAAPTARVIAFAVPDNEAEVVALAEAGVAGFVSRERPLSELVAAIESARQGEVFCSPSIAAALLHRVAALASVRQAPAATRLTARELEIVDLIDAGLTNRQIASRLCIELATVKNHVHNILEKLEVTHRAEAVARVRSKVA
jgi:two-component system nitrate/nitrite response regulator NarL